MVSLNRRFFIALVLLCTPPAAWATPDCSKYTRHGLALGMSNRQVWQTMGEKGEEEGRRPGPLGYRSIERYEVSPAAILVHYDRAVSKKMTGRIVMIETQFEERYTPIAPLIDSLVQAFGQPTTGGDNLEVALRNGPVQWIDRECDVRITATLESPSWWEPTEGIEVHVLLESLSFAEQGADRGPQDRSMTMAGMTSSDATERAPSEVTAPPVRVPVSATGSGGNAPVRRSASLAVVPVATDGTDTDTNPPQDAGRSEPYVAGVGGVVPPERLSARLPRLPMSSRLRTVQGQVILQALVLKDGTVSDVQVQRVTEPGHGMEQAAVKAVRKWRYKPATLNGDPVDALITVAVNFE